MMREYWQGVAYGFSFVQPMFKHRCDAFVAVTLHQKDVVGERLCIYVHMLYADWFLDDDGVSLKHIYRLEDPDYHMGIVNRHMEKEYGGWIGVCPNWRVRGKFGILDSPGGDKASFLERRDLFIEAVDWAGRYCYDACA